VTTKRASAVGKHRKTISRRDFLKCTGTVVLVVGSGGYVYGSSISKNSEAPLAGRPDIPPSDGYLLVDIEKCQGCASCMLACSLVHEGVESQSLSRIQIIQNSFEAFPHDLTIEQCRQCVKPACVEACPEDALKANAEFGNIRTVDLSKCIGCGACTEACPFTPSRSVLAPDENFKGDDKARKCDLCANAPFHWHKAGGGPLGKQACVEVCPVGAIRFTRKIPVQEGDKGYKVNLRLKDSGWRSMGYPIS
jgi:protein NrfC